VFSVVASSTHGPLTYRWRKDGIELNDAPPRVTGAGTPTLTLNPVLCDDAAQYDIWLDDGCGPFVSDVVTLAVVPPGDVNCDGQVTFADIDWFVEALAGESAWTHACRWSQADLNADGRVTFADIDPFVARIGTHCP
jgi:hypothetical protein